MTGAFIRRVLLIAALAATGTTAGSAVSEAMPKLASVGASFQDASGEDPAGPDITTVTVSSDEAGKLTLRVAIPNRPVLTEDIRIRIWLDVDDDRRTGLTVGGLLGADAFVLVDRWELGLGEVGLFTCSGSSCSGGRAPPPSSLRLSYRDGPTFSVSGADLGIDRLRRMRFWIEAWTGIGFNAEIRRYDFTNARFDFAPNGAGRRLGEPGAVGDDSWIYESRAMLVRSFSAVPATPRAGRELTLRLALVRTDTGRLLTSGTVSCTTRIAGSPLPPLASGFVGARAVCTFAIPANAQGRRFRSTISVRFRSSIASRSISGIVR